MAIKAVAKFGTVSETVTRRGPGKTGPKAVVAQAVHLEPVNLPTPIAKDYVVERNGVRYAGTHLLVEFWESGNLDSPAAIENAMREAVAEAGATLLYLHSHHFTPNGGVSAVAVLAESHISIHTWPERRYAAVDIFMCGACDPYKAVPAFRRAFAPGSVQLSEHKRGILG